MCDCIEKIDEALKNTNTILDIPYVVDMKTGERAPERMQIATAKADSKSRQQKHVLFAAYCPLCGERYANAPEAAP